LGYTLEIMFFNYNLFLGGEYYLEFQRG